jgi:hypothetical protein
MGMKVLRSESIPIRASEDIVLARQAVRKQAVALGFGLVDQTKIVTASSEYAERAIMRSHNTEQAVWLAFQRWGTPHYSGSKSEAISASIWIGLRTSLTESSTGTP